MLHELLVHLGVLDRHKRDQIMQLLWMKWPPVCKREGKKDKESARKGGGKRARDSVCVHEKKNPAASLGPPVCKRERGPGE